MAVGDTAMARVWGTLGNRAGAVPTVWTTPWPRSAGVPFDMPLRIAVLGHLDRCMGDIETGGNQVATNGVHRQTAHVHPLADPTLPSMILPSSPSAPEGGSCHMSLPRIPAIAGVGR